MDPDEEKAEMREYELAVLAPDEAYETPLHARAEVIQKDGPKSVPLAYPIRKHLTAFMRVYILRMAPDAARELNAAVEADQNVLRHLMITPPIAHRRSESAGSERQDKGDAVRPTSPEAVSNAALEAALSNMLGTDESR